MGDRRERDHKWYSSFDAKRMVIVLEGGGEGNEDIEIPAKYEVCETCEGKGSHVNPSIDSNGITASEMDELGPDFMEDYVSGVYDVRCNECGGERLVPVVDEERAGEVLTKIANEWIESHYQTQAEYEAERRMGA